MELISICSLLFYDIQAMVWIKDINKFILIWVVTEKTVICVETKENT
jgi:hypothetical protein